MFRQSRAIASILGFMAPSPMKTRPTPSGSNNLAAWSSVSQAP